MVSYPNPTTGETVFAFILPKSAYVKLDIYTVSGRKVKNFDEGLLSAGDNQLPTGSSWNCNDEYGNPLSNGVYLYNITVTDDEGATFQKVGKITIMR